MLALRETSLAATGVGVERLPGPFIGPSLNGLPWLPSLSYFKSTSLIRWRITRFTDPHHILPIFRKRLYQSL